MDASPLLVGFSGGLDSSVLLHQVASDATLRARGLRAIHVHHGLHSDADAWAAHCAHVCAELGIALETVRVEVPRDSGDGLEAAARDARHAAFAAGLDDGEILLLAQHRDDQAETLLLRLLRGSGVDGLAAMRPWRRFGRGWLWRPLLDTPREALHAYARAHGLRWIDDPSNDDRRHDRNYLRHQVMPALRMRWPHADAVLARAATLQGEASRMLAAEDDMLLASARTVDPRCLRIEVLAVLPLERRARVLRRWIECQGLPPLPGNAIATIERELLGDDPGDNAAFAWCNAAIRRWRDLLRAGVAQPQLPKDFDSEWDGHSALALPGVGELRFEPALQDAVPDASGSPVAPPFRVHARRGGERITLPGRRHSHALKHVLQDLGIPPWLRERLPLLSGRDGSLLAAGDLVFSAGFDAWLRQHRLRLAWDHGG